MVKLSLLQTGCSKDPASSVPDVIVLGEHGKSGDSGFWIEPLGCLVASSYLQEMLTSGNLEVPYFFSARTGRTIAASSCDLERGWVLFRDSDSAIREGPSSWQGWSDNVCIRD